MTISIDAEKTFDKIQHLLVIKSLTKMGTEETYFNRIKAICDKCTTNIAFNGEKLKTFPRPGMRQVMFYSPLYSAWSGSPNDQLSKEKK